MKQFTSKAQKIGEIGENIACMFLMKQGFDVIERNYTKKWGEIDVVAKKDKVVHFIEVKSVSRTNLDSVSDETYRPEDNMHPWKQKRLMRAVETYILDRNIEGDWQFDVACVYLDNENRKAKVKMIEDVILG